MAVRTVVGIKGWYSPQGLLSMPINNINLFGQHHLTWKSVSSARKSNFSRPRSWSLGNATLVVAERIGWRRVLGASQPRPYTKGAQPCRKRACLEALRLAATKLTQRRTGYPSWGHTTQLRISRGNTGLIYTWRLRQERGQWIQV
jgi:hypothetical protein